jgi:hypothetical protein
MIEIRFDKTKDEVALLIWFLVDHSVELLIILLQETEQPLYSSDLAPRDYNLFSKLKSDLQSTFNVLK